MEVKTSEGIGRVHSTTNALFYFSTLRTGDADLRFYITTVQDG